MLKIKKINYRFIILIVSLITTTLSILPVLYFTDNSNRDETFSLKVATIEPNQEPIYIDGQACGIDAHNWTWASEQDWCSGSGNYYDPYIIKDLIIDCNGEDCGIVIENSQLYFIIKNCIIYNTGLDPGLPFEQNRAGIKLLNVMNALIFSNNCSHNANGIKIDNCQNVLIYENYLSTNLGSGITMISCENCEIFKNIFQNEEGGYGIILWQSNDIILSKNTLRNAESDCSIWCVETLNIMILRNKIINAYPAGIALELSEGCIIAWNSLVYRPECPGNPQDCILLTECNNNKILNNIIRHYSQGIHLEFSFNNIILDNFITEILEIALFLEESDNNLISGNKIESNYGFSGMVLEISNYNEVLGNIIIDNEGNGISFHDGDHNIVLWNIINNNNDIGIFCDELSIQNQIFKNFIYGNNENGLDDGIELDIRNIWDNGAIGNYWGDYQGNDENDDGIGDIPYEIPGIANNLDHYPIYIS